MAEHLAADLIHLPDITLAADRIAKLRLHHAKGGLDIRSLVIVLKNLLTIVHKIVVHLCSDGVAFRHGCVDLKRDKRRSIGHRDGVKVRVAQIRLVCRQLLHLEILGRVL